MTADKQSSVSEFQKRVNAEIQDNLDEEIELVLEDDRLADLLSETERLQTHDTLPRLLYFKELLRLQRELIKLMDWVVFKKLKLVVIFEGRDAAGKGGVIKRLTPAPQSAGLPHRRAACADRARARPMVLPALRPAPAYGRRDRAVRPQLVQPRRRRTRDGLLHGRRIRGVLPFRAGVRAPAGAIWNRAGQVLVLDHRRRTESTLPDAHQRSVETMEALADGPRVTPALGALYQGQGDNARAHPHPRSALVGGGSGPQEACAPQLHRPSPDPHPLPRSAKSRSCPSAHIPPTITGPRFRKKRDVRARPLREPHESRFATLSVSAEEKEVSRRAARYGGG